MAWDNIGYLTCAHCSVQFSGTLRQVKRVKYEHAPTYCSSACRQAAASQRLRTPVPTHGPCPTCGNMFESRTRKTFCSLACYNASSQFKKMIAGNMRELKATQAQRHEEFRKAHTVPCLECGTEFYAKPHKKKRFCTMRCYRAYFAKRFDRWIASPERIALPQNFDEFLTQEELPCLVAGCTWTGHGLSLHMNHSHGIPADEFKRAAGFNLSTGVISAQLSEAMSARAPTGVAIQPPYPRRRGEPTGYVSLEGREHRRKARALIGSGPARECQYCAKPFQQSTPFGRAKYCSKACQSKAGQVKAKTKVGELACCECGRLFLAIQVQKTRASRGLPVVCSIICRNRWAGRIKRARTAEHSC